MLSKSRIQEPNSDPGQNSSPLPFVLGRIGEVHHDTRHKVTSTSDNRSLAESSHPIHQVAETERDRATPGRNSSC